MIQTFCVHSFKKSVQHLETGLLVQLMPLFVKCFKVVFIWHVMIMMFVSEEGRDLCLRAMVEKSRKLCNCSLLIAGIHDLASPLANAKGHNQFIPDVDLCVMYK